MAKDTPTAPPTANKSGITLTPRELEILSAAIAKCTKEPVTIDYTKLAALIGSANPASAKSSWHGVKKKLERGAEGAAGGDEAEADADEVEATAEIAAEVKKGGKGTKRKVADVKAEEDEEEGGVVEAPVKKARKAAGAKKGKAAAAVEEDGAEVHEENEEEAEVVKSPVRKARKAAVSKKGKAAVVGDDGDEAVKAESDEEVAKKVPAKKARKAAGGKKAKAAVEAGGDEEMEGEAGEPEKRGRPARAKKLTAKAAEAEEREGDE